MSSSLASAANAQIAREMRERFAQRIDGAVDALAQALLQQLLTRSTETGTVRDMQANRDNLLRYQAAQADWVARFHAQWRQASMGGAATAGAGSGNTLRLELLGDDVVETNILVMRLALAIQDKASFQFNDLRLRVQSLEGGSDLTLKDVLRPELLSRLLIEQWLAAGLARELWEALQIQLHAQLGAAALDAYQEANTFLIDKGVMPEIDLRQLVRKPPGAAAGARPGPGPAGGQPVAGGSGASGQAPGPVGHTTLRAPFSQAGDLAGYEVGVGGLGPALAGGRAPLAAARQRAQGVLLGLRRLVGAVAGGGAGGGGSPAFLDVIADAGLAYQAGSSVFMAHGGGAAMVQRSAEDLRRRANELKQKAPSSADKATVEIVALMFQAILAEERIPFSARVWFARLQMPVLRVAIAEPEFFGTLAHPARMLIDRMGSVVMGFDAAAISGSALEGEIRRVVQVIEQYPETGQRVFKLVYDEFVAFLGKYLTEGEATRKLMSVAQQVEQKETMAIQYTIELRKMLNDMPVREEIREFLFKVWAEVLAMAAIKYGGQDEQTVLFKGVASELVWAASAKPNRADRARVIQALPALLQHLRQGMELLGVVGAAQEQHIKQIGKILSDAFMSKTEAITQAQIEAMATRLSRLEDVVGEGDGEGEGDEGLPLDVPSIELMLGVDAASIEVLPNAGVEVSEDMRAWAHQLEIGDWFRLDHNGRVTQVQFVWRTDRRRLHLFATSDGHKFLIQAGRLAAYLQAGLLAPAEQEALTERANREALAKLSANPERLG